MPAHQRLPGTAPSGFAAVHPTKNYTCMKIHPMTRRIILISTILLLFVLAYILLMGGFSQLFRSLTIGQKVETTVQIICGLLCLLNAVTCFYWKNLSRRIRTAWIISLTTTAGMSSIVWGPPMFGIGAVFAAAAYFAAIGIIKLLKIGGA